ncbi:hypothetical protein [Aliifodinibius salipaludis]|uniref:hypothetical protein n=1 Tax=Fodinibius salipaludis TaxID=2032627 RepID=UPI001C3E9132|nr:hypothetical protein [Aliifodinibius salipaludis]
MVAGEHVERPDTGPGKHPKDDDIEQQKTQKSTEQRMDDAFAERRNPLVGTFIDM